MMAKANGTKPSSHPADLDQYCETGQMRIRYRLTPSASKAKGRVLILPGFTEFIEKHQDQIDSFNALGLDTLTLDWPSQGLSTRLNPKKPQLVHCKTLSQHIKALDAVMAETGFGDETLPLFVFGHSMGGHLALRYASNNPWIKGVMLSAPMMMPPIRPHGLIKALLDFLVKLGIGGWPVFFRQDKLQDQLMARQFYALNPLTRDPEGYKLQFNWFIKNPDLRVTGPSFGWVRAAYQSCFKFTGNPEILAAIKIPVQAHIAGDEWVVDGAFSRKMLPHLGNVELYEYAKARHELMLELPQVRAEIWQKFKAFINSHIE